MTKRTRTNLSMFRTVATCLTDNATIIAQIPALQSAVATFLSTLEDARDLVGNATSNKKGITEDKAKAKLAMCQAALQLIGPIYSYAMDIRDLEMAKNVDYSLTDLRRRRDTSCAALSQSFADLASDHLPQLASYGITPATVTTYATLVADFIEKNTNPRLAIVHRKTTNQQLVQTCAALSNLLRTRIDTLIITLRAAHPDFVTAYFLCRKAINRSIRHTGLHVVVTSPQSTPIPNVTVTIVSTKQTQTTNANGEATFPRVTPGLQTIRIQPTNPTTQPLETTINLIRGKKCPLTITLPHT